MTPPDTPIRPPFDTELEATGPTTPPRAPLAPDTLAAARERVVREQRAVALDLTAGGRVLVDDRDVPGPPGQPDVAVTVLRPAAATAPLPAILFIHGGGMVSGNRWSGVDEPLAYAAEGLAVVVTVDYRLAPEHPDPAPVEDCFAALAWLADAAGELGVDPGRILVMGVSAGGGLAAGVALAARDRGFPALTHQVLVCPMLDDRLETPSSRMLDGEGSWDRNDNLFGWTALLGERRGGPDVSPYAAPARAADLGGLPRTYLDVGSVETFRDEVLAYAQRLSQAGVSVDLHLWGGGFHGFDLRYPLAALSRASRATRDEFVRRALAQ